MSPPGRQGHELAVLLSVASRVEPELMRTVRIAVAPLLDVSAESDLWFGNLVERRGYGYVSLRSDLLPSLRAELADRLAGSPAGAPVHRLWSVIEHLHKDRSPALFAEERATWLAIRDGAGADLAIERALKPALRALVEGRDGIARWFAGAWPRLPDPVRRTTTAWQLATVTSARLSGVSLRPEIPERLSVTDIGLIAARLPRVSLRVRRYGPDLLLGERADGTGGFTIEVPDTDPRVLDLLDDPLPRTLLVSRGATVTERVGWGPVQLLAADGAVYALPAPSPVPERSVRLSTHGAPDRRITIAHTGASQAWGTWIANQAEDAGFGVTAVLWYPDPARALWDELGGLLRGPGRTLLVLGDTDCRLAGRGDDEWNAALPEAAADRPGRLAAVLVGSGQRPAAVGTLPLADLRAVDEREAARRLFALLGTPLTGAGVSTGNGDRRTADPRFPGIAPAISNAPLRNPRFTGREALLTRIRQALLAPGPEPGGADHHRCALLGPSGTGKTQTATEYVHRYGNEYDVVWWISAGFQGTAREQLAALASELRLAAGQGVGYRIRAVQAALRVGQPYHRWLLVLDRADDLTETEDLLPEGAGHVLITSNSRAWADNERVHRIDVPPFSRAESIAYTRSRAPRLNLAEADLLAEAVQDLPLLLSHTAAWLDAHPMPVADYLELVHHGHSGRLDQAVTGGGSAGYPQALESSWSITLTSLREHHPALVELLKLFTCFSPDAVPVHLLWKERRADLPSRIAALAADRQAWDAALQRLAETSAVRLVFGDDGVQRAEVHRLYHSLLRESLGEDERDLFSQVACDTLAAADPGDPLDARTWSRYAELIPHLEISGGLDSTRDSVSRMVLNCIEYLRSCGEARAGLRLCELTIARWHRRMPPDSGQLLILTHQHANMLRRVGRYQEAEAVGRAVVDRLAARRPAEDAELLRAQNGLGGTLVALGAYREAYELFSHTVHAETAARGAEATLSAQARSNLANVLDLLGRYEESYELYGSLVSRMREEAGPGHYRTLYNELRCCWTLRLRGRYPKALAWQRANLKDYREVMGRYAVSSMVAEHNLALCLRRSGQLPQADGIMREIVELARQLHGPRHPQALFVAADYASLLREQRDLDHAWTLADRVARDYADLLGDAHPFSVGTSANVGLTLWESGDRDEALRIAERALRGMTAAMGADHPWTLGCSLNVSGARSLVGDAEGAAGYSRDCMDRSARAVGSAHPLTLLCKAALAADLRALRQHDAADRLERETLGQLVENLGADSPFTLSVRRGERPYWDFEPQPE
ncbi:FxSxx-COOH system tetratricopeptide repeat protein [Streptomyces sp. ME02-8801-2C]|uniref:FxSxx-COOH system tetratricopeptide repeat protein n=1 Tax=Streptomyces sp. ME02-8801-2C TaxID=3028680 RepID=UPI0029B3A95C|nr:FxSxx-COOH system tetratricopeptide repeat protein [Streptomyces sp. ME02-8801-2C]MDX3451045.1 FxSxx-COOH system tetratricopeptide repeat protein [Streptomyces sp. ME02-8801-2C]